MTITTATGVDITITKSRRDRNAAALVEAINDGTLVRLVYTDADGVTSIRVVQPVKVRRTKKGHAILLAWDAHRDDARTFCIDRIIMAVPTAGTALVCFAAATGTEA